MYLTEWNNEDIFNLGGRQIYSNFGQVKIWEMSGSGGGGRERKYFSFNRISFGTDFFLVAPGIQNNYQEIVQHSVFINDQLTLYTT